MTPINQPAVASVAVAEVVPLTSLRTATLAVLTQQARLRRELVTTCLDALNRAPTILDAIEALRAHGQSLEGMGLYDEAARLRALAKAVETDFARALTEAFDLERLAVAPHP